MAKLIKKNDHTVSEKFKQNDLVNGIAGRRILGYETKDQVQNYLGIGRKNLIINGDMRIAQRGTNHTASTNGYGNYLTCDRWSAYYSGTQFQQTDVTVNNRKLKALRNTAGRIYMYQKIEGAGALLGGGEPFSISFWARSSRPWNHQIEMRWYDSNTENNGVDKTVDFFVIDEEWRYYKFEGFRFQDPNWVGSNRDLFFLLTGGSDTSGTGQWTEITEVQIEQGETCTPFEQRTYAEELALCQRYYYRMWSNGGASRVAVSGNYSGSGHYPTVMLPTAMHHQPSISYSSLNAFKFETFSSNNATPSSITYNALTKTYNGGNQDIIALTLNVSTSQTEGGNLLLRGTANADFIEFDAEI